MRNELSAVRERFLNKPSLCPTWFDKVAPNFASFHQEKSAAGILRSLFETWNFARPTVRRRSVCSDREDRADVRGGSRIRREKRRSRRKSPGSFRNQKVVKELRYRRYATSAGFTIISSNHSRSSRILHLSSELPLVHQAREVINNRRARRKRLQVFSKKELIPNGLREQLKVSLIFSREVSRTTVALKRTLEITQRCTLTSCFTSHVRSLCSAYTNNCEARLAVSRVSSKRSPLRDNRHYHTLNCLAQSRAVCNNVADSFIALYIQWTDTRAIIISPKKCVPRAWFSRRGRHAIIYSWRKPYWERVPLRSRSIRPRQDRICIDVCREPICFGRKSSTVVWHREILGISIFRSQLSASPRCNDWVDYGIKESFIWFQRIHNVSTLLDLALSFIFSSSLARGRRNIYARR